MSDAELQSEEQLLCIEIDLIDSDASAGGDSGTGDVAGTDTATDDATEHDVPRELIQRRARQVEKRLRNSTAARRPQP